MHPVLLELPFGDTVIAIHSFGVALALALVVGWYVVTLAPADGLDRRTRARAFVAMLGGAAVGALLGRLFGGGGLSLAVLGSFASLRVMGPPATLGRHGAVLLGLAVTAWGVGVWLDGAVFGFPLGEDAPEWLRRLGTYSRWADGTGAPALFAQIGEGWRPLDAADSLPTHPVGLYYAAFGVGLAALGLLRRGAEETVWLLVGLFGVGRMLLDGWRHDLSPAALSAERGLACAVLLISVVGLWFRVARPDRAPAPADSKPEDPEDAAEPEDGESGALSR